MAPPAVVVWGAGGVGCSRGNGGALLGLATARLGRQGIWISSPWSTGTVMICCAFLCGRDEHPRSLILSIYDPPIRAMRNGTSRLTRRLLVRRACRGHDRCRHLAVAVGDSGAHVPERDRNAIDRFARNLPPPAARPTPMCPGWTSGMDAMSGPRHR